MKRKFVSSSVVFFVLACVLAFVSQVVNSSSNTISETGPAPAPDILLGGGLDLIATGLEVTQGTQNLNNTVRLVAGKRTYARFYVRSNGENAVVTARLTVTNGTNSVVLAPLNTGTEVNVLQNPSRNQGLQSFNFRIPDEYTVAGSIGLSAEANPQPSAVPEADFSNNGLSIAIGTLQFETVPPFTLVIYNIGYTVNDVEYFPKDTEAQALVNWIRKAWAVSDVTFLERRESIRETLGADRLPTCSEVNDFLMSKRTIDLQNPSPGVTASTRYYGMVADGGGFMRGCANGLPGFVSSGPTGVPQQNNAGSLGNWDTDGTYGDWYGAHEISHNLGRLHAEFCDAQGGGPFPNPNGSISPTNEGPGAVFGLDLTTKVVYGTNWADNMSYCPRQWTSDFTVNGLMSFMQQNVGAREEADLSPSAPVDSLMVIGTIHQSPSLSVSLEPVYFIPGAVDVTNHTSGNYAVVLRNSANAELSRYTFDPDQVAEENTPTQHFPTDELAITELVPYVAGTTKVEIAGPGGVVIGTITAGINPPIVGTPTVGAITPGQPVSLTWTASDPDNDPLTFDIEYSNDNGTTWRVIESYLRGDRIQTGATFSKSVDYGDVTSGARARFRILATDGIHTGMGTSSTFKVPNHAPTASIEEPGDEITVTAGEALTFLADAYDIDEGLPRKDEMHWTSSINGELGSGYEVAVSTLSVGTHTITFTVNDGRGGVASDSVIVHVSNSRIRQNNNDFDGDGRSDVAVFRPSNGTWYVQRSSDGSNQTTQWGLNGDIPVQADYDRDGTTDIAVYRPSTGIWYIRQSAHSSFRYEEFGVNGDIPVPADYDGDGRVDIAVFRPSSGVWYIKQSSDNVVRSVKWGVSGDQPVAADYDGDTMTDVAVYRPGDNVWYIINSSTNTFRIQAFGAGSDKVTQEDYDGDGETDLAIFRPGDNNWWVLKSSNSTSASQNWGISGDKPEPGDYDGDGLADLVVFRPSNGLWSIRQSSNGSVRFVSYGLSTDIPL